MWTRYDARRALTLDEALLVLTTKLHYLPNALTLALDIYLHMDAGRWTLGSGERGAGQRG